MKRFSIILGVGVIVSLVFTEAHSLFRLIDPLSADKPLDLFLSPSFHMQLPFQWYLKMTFDDLFLIVITFTAAIVARRYSFKMFSLFCLVFIYKAIDVFLFWWNYKISFATYYVLITFIAAWIILIIFHKDRNQSIYKSME
jgi:hypothetical protein